MPAENAGRAFSLVLVDELVHQGIRHAVVAPGSRSTPIALALLENPAVTVHVRIDERSAAYLALGIAKASGTVVPVLCTSGTAASYFHGAVMEADLSRVPLLVLTADRPPELHGIGANQTVDQQGMYGDTVRWAPVIGTPEASPDSVAIWRWIAAEAAARALGRPFGATAGPVHLNLPLREPLTATDDGIGFPYPLDGGAPVSADLMGPPVAPPALANRVRQTTRGVVVVGDLPVRVTDEVSAFAERAGWPVIAEPHSNARHGAMALRSTDALLRDKAFTDTHRPDLVMVIGRVGLSRALLTWLATVPHIVVSPGGGNWDVTRSAEAVIPVRRLHLLRSLEPTPADPEWAQSWLHASARVSDAIDAVIDASPTLTEPAVARDVAALIPAGAALVVSSSMPIRDLDMVMRPREDITLYSNRGVSGIDGFVSTAQGVAIARAADDGRGPTVALCGDLSLLHDSNGFLPGSETTPDVTYVVINNDGGGIFSLLPQGSAVDPAAFERLFGTPHGASIESLAAAYGIPHRLVSTAAELADALSSYGGLRIVEVRTDRAANTELHERLRQVTPRTA